MTAVEPPHRPDKETAFALLTAWRSEAPDLEHPETYSAEGLKNLFNLVGVGSDPWNVILGLVAVADQFLTNLAEVSSHDADGLLATVAQMDAEAGGGAT
ncbi:MAG: hypothetical protein ACLQRH_19090 [Acidimicrobiales bacterium]